MWTPVIIKKQQNIKNYIFTISFAQAVQVEPGQVHIKHQLLAKPALREQTCNKRRQRSRPKYY